jgi:hypothetical protein
MWTRGQGRWVELSVRLRLLQHAQAEEERWRSKEEALQRAIEGYEEHRERVSTAEQVRRALSKLTRRQ